MNKTDVLVTVVTPVFNTSDFLRECVDSVLQQTITNWELILVDDGSSDNSSMICDYYAIHDSRIHVCHTKNLGVSSARNLALELSIGEWILFLDSDDWFAIDMLERYIKIAKEYESTEVIVGGGIRMFENRSQSFIQASQEKGLMNGEVWHEITSDSLFYGYTLGKMFRREYTSRFNPTMNSQEDLDFCLRSYNKCMYIYQFNYPGYFYRFSQPSRKPRFLDYISNQLNLYRIASEHVKLTEIEIQIVRDRIEGYIYGLLDNCNNYKETLYTTNTIRNISGLSDLFYHCNATNFKQRITIWSLHGESKKIYLSMMIRRLLRKIYRFILPDRG